VIAELLKLLGEILPMIHPDEAERIRKRLEKLNEERKEVNEQLASAIKANDIDAINIIVSGILGEL